MALAYWCWLDMESFPPRPSGDPGEGNDIDHDLFIGIGTRLSGIRVSGSAHHAMGKPERVRIGVNDDEAALAIVPTSDEGFPVVGERTNKWILLGQEGSRWLFGWVHKHFDLPYRRRRFAPAVEDIEGVKGLVIRF